MLPGMARHRDEAGTRYQYADDYSRDDRESRHRRHRSRDYDDDEYAAKRERRERRRAEDVRQEAAVDVNDLRARRASYFSRPESVRYRDQDRMAQEVRAESVKTPRSSHRELRRDGTRKSKKKREVVEVDRDEDYVYGRPKSGEVRRSSGRKRSDEGGSSSRTAYTPRSGSGSSRRVEEPKISRSVYLG